MKLTEAVGMGGLGQDHREVPAAKLTRQVCHQHVIGFGDRLFADFPEKAHAGGPVAFTRHLAHRHGQRFGIEPGPFGLGRRRLRLLVEGGQRPAQPLKRELAIELLRIDRRHFEIAIGLGHLSGLRH